MPNDQELWVQSDYMALLWWKWLKKFSIILNSIETMAYCLRFGLFNFQILGQVYTVHYLPEF